MARDRLAAVVSSDATYAQKLLACKRLGQIGTGRVVPVVAPLFTDEKLSHGARIALEMIPGPASAAALRDAVPKLKGDLLVGVINSIGARRDAEAVAILGQKLHESDAQIAAAAAAALGKIGNAQATDALLGAIETVVVEARAALADACLHCAEVRLQEHGNAAAAAIYARLVHAEVPQHARLAATRAMILSLPADAAVRELATALKSDDTRQFAMALSISRATKSLVSTLWRHHRF